MGRTDRLSQLIMFYSLDAEQKELIERKLPALIWHHKILIRGRSLHF
jgi:hypothetical protein